MLDAAPASAQPLMVVAPLNHPNPTVTTGTDQGKGQGNGHGHGNGNAQWSSDALATGQGHGNVNANSRGNSHASFRHANVHRPGHSARAPGHNRSSITLSPKPQPAAPRRTPNGHPAAAVPAPPALVASPSRHLPIGSIAFRLIGTAALDLTTTNTHHPIAAEAGPALQAIVPGWLPGANFYRRELGLLGGSLSGTSFETARKLKLPIALLVGAALFMLIQSLVDRRDPKVALAPEHAQDDSLDFA